MTLHTPKAPETTVQRMVTNAMHVQNIEVETGWTRNSQGHPRPCCDDHAAGTYVEPIVVEPDVERERLVALLRDLRAQVDHPDGPWVSVNRETLRETLDLLDAGVAP